ncbi:MAG: acyltransferase [Acholeplasma sp.]|nr:acyltransferase [Acholeplasma sp.]
MIILIKKMKRIIFNYIVRSKCNHSGRNLKVNRYSVVNSQTTLGNNCNFNGMRILGKGEVKIGDNFHSGENCIILTEIHNYDSEVSIPYDNTTIIKPVTIGDNVWFGINVIVLPGIKIEEGVIIQAGSVVVNDIPKYAIAGGHPAKIFKYRDSTKYELLKSKKKFF